MKRKEFNRIWNTDRRKLERTYLEYLETDSGSCRRNDVLTSMVDWDSVDDSFCGCLFELFDCVRLGSTRQRVLRKYPFCSTPVYERNLDCRTEGTE